MYLKSRLAGGQLKEEREAPVIDVSSQPVSQGEDRKKHVINSAEGGRMGYF